MGTTLLIALITTTPLNKTLIKHGIGRQHMM
jgi:hypothetical protein